MLNSLYMIFSIVRKWVNKGYVTISHYSGIRRRAEWYSSTIWMHLEGIMLSELSQAQGTMMSLICGIKKIKTTTTKKNPWKIKVLFVQIREENCWCQELESFGKGLDVYFEMVKVHWMSVWIISWPLAAFTFREIWWLAPYVNFAYSNIH